MNETFNFPELFNKYDLDINKYNNREKIEIIEYILFKTCDNIADDMPVGHYIHAGMYERTLFIPAGTILTGKIHLIPHMFRLLAGELSVMSDNGVMKRIAAPERFDVTANTKKIGYAHTDVLCSTVHRTDLTDIDEIEKEALADSNLEWVNNLLDYKQFLIDVNLTEDIVSDISRNENDLDFSENDGIFLSESSIQGQGIFANKDFKAGDFIAKSRVNNKRDLAGRYTNHALNNNAKMILLDNNDMNIMAIADIKQNDEITVNYREAMLCQE